MIHIHDSSTSHTHSSFQTNNDQAVADSRFAHLFHALNEKTKPNGSAIKQRSRRCSIINLECSSQDVTSTTEAVLLAWLAARSEGLPSAISMALIRLAPGPLAK